jgi:tryptophanyl-tRNA synthetase
VPGLDGQKMSKSYGNTINLADPPDLIRQKCMGMFTDPTRVRRSDPGHPDTCNLFQFHRLISSADLQERVDRECRLAQIGCVDDKKLIAEQLIEFLRPMRERREQLLRDRSTLLEVLREGSRKAGERAAVTMEAVRGVLGLDYGRLLERAGR